MRPSPSELAVHHAWRKIDNDYLADVVAQLRTKSVRPFVCMLCETEYSCLPKERKCKQCGRAAVARKREVVRDCIRSLFNAYKTAYHGQPDIMVQKFREKCQTVGVDPYDYITIPQ